MLAFTPCLLLALIAQVGPVPSPSPLEFFPGGDTQRSVSLSGPAFTQERPASPRPSASSWMRGIAPISPFSGDLIVGDNPPNETLTISGPFEFEGRIIVVNQGRVHFQNAEARIRGSLIVLNDGVVEIDGGSMTLVSSYLYQHTSIVLEQGSLLVRNARLDYVGGTYGLFLGDDALVLFDSVQSNGEVTVSLDGRAQFRGNRIDRAGEFVVLGENDVRFVDTTFIILWLTFGQGTVADLTFPDGAQVDWFQYPGANPGPTDPPWQAELLNCHDVIFTVMTEAGCDLTLRDSQVRATGLIFRDGQQQLSGIVNGQHYANHELPVADRRIALVNAGVDSWNAYTLSPKAALSIEHCILGEILTIGGVSNIQDTIVDGTGGYLSAVGASFSAVIQSLILSPITVREAATMILGWSGMPAGELRIDTDGVLVAVQTPLRVRPQVDGRGLSAISWLDAPVDPRTGTDVVLSGTVIFDGGPESPDDLSGYLVEVASVDQPDSWRLVGAGAQETWSDPLAIWNTRGLAPGGYLLRLKSWDWHGNAVELTDSVQLEP